ncbi:hypothetical protein F442_01485 [Phytophthora nicotianae P10297]|uniref:START domain-containing protein n=4 Tax=Phytophthora nicotianae TaxID=4792 RepID=W2QT14_PHYN3|nr:hypothetical protein PPTG_06688 [Phytophthora nicotianae INRA-310]ETK95627.1 hypothetical protein L915_01464 [Phytophthora nicotianae]ETO84592.1 hypothetical protein F444_01537 [Phytophthora nicotianae P1976]ETP53637.1 hypothetical protein F442_01485 [Phytophthora nicotianae P10297]KUF79547.1 hypothetical protein AM587_10008979 [Phytophthora nicotianae]ETM02056.1 hypothetical protein L917_01423 [Phytophthora nicotianae]
MGKNRFVVNPFGHLALSELDRSKLKEFAYNFFDQSVLKYEAFIGDGGPKVDPKEWKLIKTKDDTRVYLEREPPIRTSISGSVSDHPGLLMTGVTWGTVEDCMYGAYSPTLEAMRLKASYVEDMSGGAVLAVLEEPTPEDPFRSMTIKWVELDLPFNATSLVKNRDYVFIEYMKTVKLSNGERIGCQIYHSINFPQTKELPNRVRASMTACGIFRQLGPDTVEVYGSGIVDPAGDMIKAFVIPSMATGYLSLLKYAHCSKMKKIVWLLGKRYEQSKELGAPSKAHICVTCCTPILKLTRGDYGRSEGSTCKLCVGYLCRSCRIQRKLTFMTSVLQMEQRKVSFCGLCLQQARTMSPMGVINDQMQSSSKHQLSNSCGTIDSSYASSTTSEYCSSTLSEPTG